MGEDRKSRVDIQREKKSSWRQRTNHGLTRLQGLEVKAVRSKGFVRLWHKKMGHRVPVHNKQGRTIFLRPP